MRKQVRKLVLEHYESTIQYGAAKLCTFENFVLIEGTDGMGEPHYLVLESIDGSPVDFDGDGSGTNFYELELEDFYQLCAYYLISLQPGMEHALSTLKNELDIINKFVK